MIHCVLSFSILKSLNTVKYTDFCRSFTLVSCVATVALAGCGGSGESDKARQAAQTAITEDAKAAKKQVDQLQGATLKDGELSGGDSKGRPLWRVAAKEIRVFNESAEKGQGGSAPRRAELKDATAEIYVEGKLDSSFRAPKLTVNYTPKGVRLVLQGGVQVESRGQWSGPRGPVLLTSPQAAVDIKARRIWAGKGVRLVQGTAKNRIHVVADQLNANTNLKTTSLAGGVKAGSSLGNFTAREAVWNWETGQASAKGNVSAVHDGTTITGAQLNADTRAGRGMLSGSAQAIAKSGRATAQTVRYNWNTGSLEAGGGVVLTKDDMTLRAGSITTDDKLQRAVATGSVRVQQKDVHITAGRATATGLDSKAVQVVASGGVTATNKDGNVRADSVTYGGGKIVASGGVTLNKDGHRLSGSRLVTDEKFNTATLTGNIKGRMANGATFAAGTLVYRKNSGIEARNGAQAQRGELRLQADKLTAAPDGKQILLTGNVVVTNQEGVTVRSATARYDRDAQKVFAPGAVTLNDPKRGIKQTGRGLVADLRLKEVTLTGVSGSGKMDVFKDKKLFD